MEKFVYIFLVKIQEITLSQGKYLRTLCVDITLLPWKQAKGIKSSAGKYCFDDDKCIIAEIKVLGGLRSTQKMQITFIKFDVRLCFDN